MLLPCPFLLIFLFAEVKHEGNFNGHPPSMPLPLSGSKDNYQGKLIKGLNHGLHNPQDHHPPGWHLGGWGNSPWKLPASCHLAMWAQRDLQLHSETLEAKHGKGGCGDPWENLETSIGNVWSTHSTKDKQHIFMFYIHKYMCMYVSMKNVLMNAVELQETWCFFVRLTNIIPLLSHLSPTTSFDASQQSLPTPRSLVSVIVAPVPEWALK